MICYYVIKPKYEKVIQYSKQKNGKISTTLIGKVTKAIYGGILLGARLFYDELRGILIDQYMGFELNDYNKCTLNSQ